jgi:aspartate aminotransferase
MSKVQGHSTSNPNSIAQYAALEALRGPQDSVGIMLAEYTARRAWLLNELKQIPGITCNEPEGAFYAFPNVEGCLRGQLKTSAEFAQNLLDEEQTVVTDGTGFGAPGYVRISYATSMDQLREGIKRIRRFTSRRA